jgi:gamma-glutamylcyclotransferase (GGCT)/AIG2-like uncharacterized protein YtfP
MNNIFVYGTLKKQNQIRGLSMFTAQENFVGEALTSESIFDMYSMGDFPAVTPNGQYKIKGEVWSVEDDVFELLDRIEGYPDFYSRAEIQTTLGKAWIYYINDIQELEGLSQVPPVNNEYIEWLE